MRKLIGFLIASLVAGCAPGIPLYAAQPAVFPMAILPPTPMYSNVYPSFAEAAHAAIADSYRLSNLYEYGGVIAAAPDHTFRVSVPETYWRGDATHIDTDPDLFPGLKPVATFHTHPCLPYSHYPWFFSPMDVATAKEENLTAIMGDFCTGQIHEFVPGYDVEGKHLIGSTDLPTGHTVGGIALYRVPIILELNPHACSSDSLQRLAAVALQLVVHNRARFAIACW
jgi:hypothetical protein